MRTLAHISDLHLGESWEHERRAALLVESLLEQNVEHVILSGDVTHSGRVDEYETYLALFRPLLEAKKVTVVPGNHDRAGDDVAELLSDELRVSVDARDGLFMVCVDSTAPHNREDFFLGGATFRSHGELCERMLASVDEALSLKPAGALTTVVLHHHVLPQPVESVGEWIADRLGWPHAAELPLGRELLRRVLGRADLVLHGHKHVPRITRVGALRVCNAGSTTQLGAYRQISWNAEGIRAVRWHAFDAPAPELTAEPELALAV